MNKEQFIDYLQKPELLNDSSLKELNALLKDFPYFQTAHLLYLKNLHNLKSIHFTNKLRNAAAYSTDRSTLRKLIVQYHPTEKTDDLLEVPKIEEEQKVKETSNLTEQEQNILITLQKYRKEVGNRAIVKKEKTEKKVIFEVLESSKIENKEPTATPELNELQSEASKVEEIANKTVVFKEGITNLEKEVEPLKASAKDEGEEESENESENEVLVRERENEVEKEVEKITQKVEVAAIPLEGKRSFSEWLSLGKPSDERNYKQTEKKSDEIIKRFMANEPKLERKKAEFYSPTDKAKVSTTLNDALITETLAKIFYKQGNYEKALDSYEKLSLKIPEKKHTFAAQINIIKQKLAEGKTATKKKKSK